MGVKVDLIEEIKSRLIAAKADGGPLSMLKMLRVGGSYDVKRPNELPYVTVELKSGREEAHTQQRTFRDLMIIEVRLVCSRLGQALNAQYKISDESGPIFLLERILNALDKNSSGVIDLNFSGKAESLRSYSYNLNNEGGTIEVSLDIEVMTRHFSAGGR